MELQGITAKTKFLKKGDKESKPIKFELDKFKSEKRKKRLRRKLSKKELRDKQAKEADKMIMSEEGKLKKEGVPIKIWGQQKSVNRLDKARKDTEDLAKKLLKIKTEKMRIKTEKDIEKKLRSLGKRK